MGNWNTWKQGIPDQRIWRKMHIGFHKEWLKMREVEIPPTRLVTILSCWPKLPEFLDHVPANREVTH